MAGLGIGASSMRSGERALLHVGWALGYGEEGIFSFPNVPPMADLFYEVELIGFDNVKEVDRSNSRLYPTLCFDYYYYYYYYYYYCEE
jgi:hypothetical protein